MPQTCLMTLCHELCKSGWTDQDVIWVVDLCGPCVWWGSRSTYMKEQFSGDRTCPGMPDDTARYMALFFLYPALDCRWAGVASFVPAVQHRCHLVMLKIHIMHGIHEPAGNYPLNSVHRCVAPGRTSGPNFRCFKSTCWNKKCTTLRVFCDLEWVKEENRGAADQGSPGKWLLKQR